MMAFATTAWDRHHGGRQAGHGMANPSGGRLKPFFPYYGSKYSMAMRYPAPVPGLPVVEPFAGSAGYSCWHGQGDVLLVDADPVIAGVWDYLIRVSEGEVMSLPELPGPGDSVDDHPGLPQEARWLIGFWLNRGSSMPKKSRTAYSARNDRSQLNWGPRAKERVASQVGAIRSWKVECGSYESCPDVEAVWFVDPPYVEKGRHYRRKFSAYGDLAAWCASRKGAVVACENEGADWLPFSPLGRFKSTRGTTSEAVWLSGWPGDR